MRGAGRSDGEGDGREPSAVLVGLRDVRDREGRPAALVPVLGRSPFQRHLHHLAALGVERFFVVVRSGDPSGDPSGPRLREACERQAAELFLDAVDLRFVSSPGSVDGTGSADLSQLPDGPVIVVRAEGVYDPRLYRAALEGPDGTWIADPRARTTAPSDGRSQRGGGEPAPVGLARHGRLAEILPEVLSEDRPRDRPSDWPRDLSEDRPRDPGEGAGRTPGSDGEPAPRSLFVGPEDRRLRVSDLDDYLPGLRRRLRPYGILVRDRDDREAAAEMILDSVQKGVLDFPARFLHPPVENFLTRLAAGTPITPNQITVATGVLGCAAAWLFATAGTGGRALALALALLVNVLDGVDGKLARVKLLTSRFGDRLDHTLDVSFEFAWYLALGWGLSGGAAGGPFRVALGIVATMIGTRAVSGVYRLLSGRQIHDHRPFDRAFRLVAGRRNIYVLVWVAGLAAGALEESFVLCLVWAAVTLAVYLVRTGMAAWERMRTSA